MVETAIPLEDYLQLLAVTIFGSFLATSGNEMLHNERVMTEEKAVTF
jgi:hypothetical protein